VNCYNNSPFLTGLRLFSRHPGEGRDPGRAQRGLASQTLNKKCGVALAPATFPCGASFCIRKNWAPRVRGVTIIWNKHTTLVIPAKAGIQAERSEDLRRRQSFVIPAKAGTQCERM